MWLAPTLGHFSDLRKTRFQEECANYLSYIINQCRAITLNLDPQLVVAINDASIKELESRSPFLSATDLAFVRDQFACNTFLPQLQHEPLREKVRDAVIQSRGPFLTFQTLARDLKVLLRIQARLQPFLDPSTRGGDNSVRQTLEDNFARRYYMLEQQRGPMPVAPFHDPSEYSRYCYEVLFLYLMRTAASKVVITEQDLQSLAVRAFEGTADSDGDEIRIARPSNLFSSFSDSYDAEVENRQGAKLFGDPAAKLLLYHDQLHASHAPDVCASPAFVARDIVYIFLHGAPPPLHLLQPPVQSLSIPARVTPHENDPEPASYGDSTGSVVTSAYTSRVSTDDWSVLQGTTKTVVRDHAEVVERNLKANESLDGAMNYATTTSSDARTQTESLTPRPSALSHSCFPSNASSRHRLAQSSRRTATFEQSSLYSANEELEDNSSTPRSFSSSMSLFRAINEVKTQVPGLAATSASTGIYHTLLPVKRQPGTSGGCETAETAHNSNGEVPGGSDCQTPTPGVKYSAEADQHAHTLKAVPTIVKFVAVEKPNLHTLVMFNKYAIKAFIESQKELDPRSSFFYWRPDDQVRKRSDVFFDSDPLANAIDRDKADTVYVNSDKLGVTDRSQLSRTAGES
ncbi:hypothetical protein E8E12_000265 [Didymella heteroderae]|uniref:Uncharacterized protein n=1 Tax=Didymella heteroderae TaxID=1769908 RepID=A0A9P5BU64_9PLEO|nr:hypothetical protein E8E12_000265 [Didymella heteroderae]